MLSGSPIEPAFSEVSAWDLFDANVRMGPSGVQGEIALEARDLLAEMDRFGIQQALVAHCAAEEYDASPIEAAQPLDLSQCANTDGSVRAASADGARRGGIRNSVLCS